MDIWTIVKLHFWSSPWCVSASIFDFHPCSCPAHQCRKGSSGKPFSRVWNKIQKPFSSVWNKIGKNPLRRHGTRYENPFWKHVYHQMSPAAGGHHSEDQPEEMAGFNSGRHLTDDHCRKAEALPLENTKKRMTRRWRRRSPLSSHSTVSPWPNQPRSHEERDDTIWLKNTSWNNDATFLHNTISKFAFQSHTYRIFGFSHQNSNCPLPHLIFWLS